MPGPLEGVQVLDAGLLVQGPQAAAMLSDMGAQVIKVELPGIVEAAFKTKTTERWCAALGTAGVRYAPVRDYRAAVADQGAWENGYFTEAKDTTGGTHRVVGTPIRMSDTPLAPAAIAPNLGQHTDEVLREAGYADAEIEAFRRVGVV